MNPEMNIQKIRLHTPRLLLRAWEQADLEDFYEYASSDGVGQMAGWLPHKSREESQKILTDFIEEGQCFAIVKDEKAIGSIEIQRYKEELFPSAKALRGRGIGFVLSRAYWNQGYMTEAVEEVLRFLFEDRGLDFVSCSHFVWNLQSARVQKKAGFHFYCKVKMTTTYGTCEHGYLNLISKEDWQRKRSLALSPSNQ